MRPSIPTLAFPAILFLGSCTLYTGKEPPPPGLPISGGSMLVTADGERAFVADSERDKIHVVDLVGNRIETTIDLEDGDQPGRLVEDGAGRIHVALRRGGAIVTIEDLAITGRRDVCSAPRGIAWQETGDLLHVACATGELVSLPAGGGAATRTLRLERDLRDVVVTGDQLYVTRFRAAELLQIGASGEVLARRTPPSTTKLVFDPNTGAESTAVAIPAVAWRTFALDDGRTVMVHQRATQAPLSTQPGGYGSGECFEGPIEVTATIFDPAVPDVVVSRRFPMAAVPVDAAISRDGDSLAVVLAGFRSVRVMPLSSLAMVPDSDPCGFGVAGEIEIFPDADAWGNPTSVAFTDGGRVVIQWDNAISLRAPSSFSSRVIALDDPIRDPGRRRFHEPTFSGLACASCHPEGRDDGLVWDFAELGSRRTQNISGGLEDRAPYHWGGDMENLSMLVNEVFVNRMGGVPLTRDEEDALRRFLFALEPLPPPSGLDQAAVTRGKALFESSTLGCARCHNGPLLTDNSMQDVGTGGTFKVPSLVGVGWRAPFIHDGCASTMRDRFDDACGGDGHGGTTVLDEQELDDLIAYLESI